MLRKTVWITTHRSTLLKWSRGWKKEKMKECKQVSCKHIRWVWCVWPLLHIKKIPPLILYRFVRRSMSSQLLTSSNTTVTPWLRPIPSVSHPCKQEQRQFRLATAVFWNMMNCKTQETDPRCVPFSPTLICSSLHMVAITACTLSCPLSFFASLPSTHSNENFKCILLLWRR